MANSSQVLTAAVKDKHSVSIYDATTGQYNGIIFVTSGEITGSPIVTPTSVSVNFIENGQPYMSIFSLPDRQFQKKVSLR